MSRELPGQAPSSSHKDNSSGRVAVAPGSWASCVSGPAGKLGGKGTPRKPGLIKSRLVCVYFWLFSASEIYPVIETRKTTQTGPRSRCSQRSVYQSLRHRIHSPGPFSAFRRGWGEGRPRNSAVCHFPADEQLQVSLSLEMSAWHVAVSCHHGRLGAFLGSTHSAVLNITAREKHLGLQTT